MQDQLFDVEGQSYFARIQLLRELSAARIPQADWPQSLHWNWAYKAATSDPTRFDLSGDARLFGIEVGGRYQGVLLGLSNGHFSRIDALAPSLVYVDYLESGPWNWDVAATQSCGKIPW